MKIFLTFLFIFSYAAETDFNSSRSNRVSEQVNYLTSELLNGPEYDFSQIIGFNERAELLKIQMILGNFVNILVRNAVDNDCNDTSDDDTRNCGIKLIFKSETEALNLYSRDGRVKFFNETKGFGFTDNERSVSRKRPGRIKYSNITLERSVSKVIMDDLTDFIINLKINDNHSKAYSNGEFLSNVQEINTNTDFFKAYSVIKKFVKELIFNLEKKDSDTIDKAPEEKERGITINTSHMNFRRAIEISELSTLDNYRKGVVKFFQGTKGFFTRQDKGVPLKVIRIKGIVNYFNPTTNNAVVCDDETGKEYFVHVSGLIDEIKDGDSVEFDLVEGQKGMNAVNVKII